MPQPSQWSAVVYNTYSTVSEMALQTHLSYKQNVIVFLCYFFYLYIYIYCHLKGTKWQTFNNSTLDFCWPDHRYFKTAASIHGTSNHSNSVSHEISWQKIFALPCKTVLYVCIYFSDCLYLVTIVKCMIP